MPPNEGLPKKITEIHHFPDDEAVPAGEPGVGSGTDTAIPELKPHNPYSRSLVESSEALTDVVGDVSNFQPPSMGDEIGAKQLREALKSGKPDGSTSEFAPPPPNENTIPLGALAAERALSDARNPFAPDGELEPIEPKGPN